MSLTSITFLLFVAITALLYYTIFHKRQWILLLIASILFYLLSGPKYFVYVLFTSFVTWRIALIIQSINDKEQLSLQTEKDKELIKENKQLVRKQKRLWLWLYLLISVGILAVIKYSNFAFLILHRILFRFGIEWSKSLYFVLPLGISFYTFMMIGYFLDVYWKRYSAEKNYFKILLFAIYFPHITQGPIGRFQQLNEQFSTEHPFDYDNACKGAQLLMWGFFEKLVIADRLAIFVNRVYNNWQITPRVPVIIALLFFSIQLYMDFQGCMDIGRGVSQILGIELDLNFKRPYFSKTMPEFWTRWHISLGKWFKDYLLYPVTMSKLCKSINRWTRQKWGQKISRLLATIIPTATVWLITGIWHGASYNYIAWGIYHGILVISSTLFEEPVRILTKTLRINTDTFSFRLFQMIRTFILSAIGRIFFLAAGVKESIRIALYIFFGSRLGLETLVNGTIYQYGLNRYNYLLCWILIVLLIMIGIAQERGIVIRDFIAEQNIVFRWFVYFALLFSIILFGMYGPGFDAASFVYGAF